MTSNHPTRAGTLLLKLARALFDDAVLRDVVRPTIADLQREVDEAGSDRRRRLAARWRGYRALWTLAIIAPVAFLRWPGRPVRERSFPEIAGRVAATAIAVTVIATASAGGWTFLPVAGGVVFAVAIHLWHRRHPSTVAVPDAPRHPEINMSRIPVGGDIGGLIFMVGSVLIIVSGLPMLGWFLLGTAVTGFALAWILSHWNARHPSSHSHVVVR